MDFPLYACFPDGSNIPYQWPCGVLHSASPPDLDIYSSMYIYIEHEILFAKVTLY
jgi:hypothetical protein